MEGIIANRLYRHQTFISPGAVGSVGDVNMTTRLKHSAPDLPLRFVDVLDEPRLGSNVQDGDSKSYTTHGMGASVIDKKWTGQRDFKISHGWKYQDIRTPDKRYEPVNLGYNAVPETYDVKVRGNAFLPVPLPQGYTIGDAIPRGGQVPRIAETIQETGFLSQGIQRNLPGEGAPIPISSVFDRVVASRPGFMPEIPIKKEK